MIVPREMDVFPFRLFESYQLTVSINHNGERETNDSRAITIRPFALRCSRKCFWPNRETIRRFAIEWHNSNRNDSLRSIQWDCSMVDYTRNVHGECVSGVDGGFWAIEQWEWHGWNVLWSQKQKSTLEFHSRSSHDDPLVADGDA